MEVLVFLKRCVLVLILAVLSCVFSPGAAAQGLINNNPCTYITTNYFPLSIPIGWVYFGPYPGTYTYLIWAFNSSCAPAKPSCSKCHSGGSAITVATSNTSITQKDIEIHGVAARVNLARTCNNMPAA